MQINANTQVDTSAAAVANKQVKVEQAKENDAPATLQEDKVTLSEEAVQTLDSGSGGGTWPDKKPD